MNIFRLKNVTASRASVVAGATALALATTAAWVQSRARRAEREHPPLGRFLDIDGVRLHYVERGNGPPVVLLHGNGVSHRDFEASGLLDRLASNHRVIAFDRPGFGHSNRPRDRLWTPKAQAALLHEALAALGVEHAAVVGHSMGSMVAMALALAYPSDVQRLVLLSGYYYPGLRADALLTAVVALPVIGDVMRYTVSAVSGRLLLNGLVKAMFAPRDVPAPFFPVLSREMMLRPLQLRANAEDAAFMIPQAKASSDRHGELKMPVAIVAGAEDLVIRAEDHSVRLHSELPQSTLTLVPGAGHMVHYAKPGEVVSAIEGQIPTRSMYTEDGTSAERSAQTEQLAA